MFTLSAIFLVEGENLFQDFWSPFSIPFICFSAQNKNNATDLRAVSDPDTRPVQAL